MALRILCGVLVLFTASSFQQFAPQIQLDGSDSSGSESGFQSNRADDDSSSGSSASLDGSMVEDRGKQFNLPPNMMPRMYARPAANVGVAFDQPVNVPPPPFAGPPPPPPFGASHKQKEEPNENAPTTLGLEASNSPSAAANVLPAIPLSPNQAKPAIAMVEAKLVEEVKAPVVNAVEKKMLDPSVSMPSAAPAAMSSAAPAAQAQAQAFAPGNAPKVRVSSLLSGILSSIMSSTLTKAMAHASAQEL